MSTPEGHIKAKVKARIGKHFPRSYRFMPVQNGMGAMTIDFFYCIEGLFVGIETKAPPKTAKSKLPEPTARQQQVLCDIAGAGGLAYLVYDDETLDQMIRNIAWHVRQVGGGIQQLAA